MRLSLLLLLLASLGYVSVFAQQGSSDFYEPPYEDGARDVQPERIILPDEGLFAVPLDGYDVFSGISEYDFSAARYRRRGYHSSFTKYYLGGLEMDDAISGRSGYAFAGALRYLGLEQGHSYGLNTGGAIAGGAGGARMYSLRPSAASQGGMLTFTASDRTARAGVRATFGGGNGRWSYAALASRRWGRDSHIGGLFIDEGVIAAGVEYSSERFGSLSFLAFVPATQRSVRSSSTAEAFGLTGDNLYNPSWGYYQGEERSSRVRESILPVGVLSYSKIFKEHNTLEASFSYSGGSSAYSGISWYDAQSPLPDYYRSMPSYISDPAVSGRTAVFWRQRDPKVTQIDWDEMSLQNTLTAGQAVYIAAQDVESFSDMQFVAGIVSRPQYRLRTGYGVRLRLDLRENYSKLKDLLGAGWVRDVDQFLVDDEFYGDMARNNMLDPDRKVGQGDKFGYDYNMMRRSASLFGSIGYGSGKWMLAAAGEIGEVSIRREGLYEKELFPGGESFGRSAVMRFPEYTFKFGATYSPWGGHSLQAGLMAACRAPRASDLFLQPRYCNITVADPRAATFAGGELSYRATVGAVRFKVTGFYTVAGNETEVFHYYDDISSTYSNLVMSGIDKLYYGVEFGAEAAFSPRIALLAAVSAGSYTYNNDPGMDMWSDACAQPVYSGESSPMSRYRLGSTPQTVAGCQLRYNGTKGWYASLSLSYMADSYVDADPTRRMRRAAAYASSPESFTAMVSQEKLPAAVTAGIFVCKYFEIAGQEFRAIVSIDNILDNKEIIYSGYEQMRMRKAGDGIDRTYTPFDSKYLYSYGRTWYCSLSYKF